MAKLNTSMALSTLTMVWDCKTRKLSEEASTVHYHHSYRLYDDAADFGVWVKSHRTGKMMPFTLKSEVTDPDGDVQAWEFEGWDQSGKVADLVIFND